MISSFARTVFLHIANNRPRHLQSFPKPDSAMRLTFIPTQLIVIGDDALEINANNSEDIRIINDAEINADEIHVNIQTDVNSADLNCRWIYTDGRNPS